MGTLARVIESLNRPMESDRNKKKMANLIDFAENLVKENEESIFTLINMVGIELSNKTMCSVLWEDLHGASDSIDFFGCVEWKDIRSVKIPHETAADNVWALELGYDVVLPWPWNKGRAVEALVNIGTGKTCGKWTQDDNHRVSLIYPIGVGIVYGGNHSIMAGIINHEGVIAGSDIIDIREFINLYDIDGAVVTEKATGNVVGVVKVFEFAALLELGRIVTRLGLEPPQITNSKSSNVDHSEVEDAIANDSARDRERVSAINKHIEKLEEISKEESKSALRPLLSGNQPIVKFFPGHHNQPIPVEYHLIPKRGGVFNNVVVFIRQKMGTGTSYINSDRGRDVIINSIIESDINGVAIEFISIIFALESMDGSECLVADEFKIRADMNDYAERGNPHTTRTLRKDGSIKELFSPSIKEISTHSRNIVAGSARVYSVFENKRVLTSAEIEELYFAIGLNVPTIYKEA